MDVTSELMAEHQFILRFNTEMRRFAEQNRDEGLLKTFGNAYIEFIECFADDYHHSKEEDILFKELVKPNVLGHCNPIPVMLYEHTEARNLKEEMKRSVTNTHFSGFKQATFAYSDHMQHHIFKEDNVLYAMAEESLSDQMKKDINIKYARIEDEKNKKDLWERFESVLTELVKLPSLQSV